MIIVGMSLNSKCYMYEARESKPVYDSLLISYSTVDNSLYVCMVLRDYRSFACIT